MRRPAALIVGGGPAGAAAAIRLERAGVRSLLVERDREVGDALCGGFLSWRTLAALEKLGVAVGGHPVRTLRLIAGGRVAEAPLPGRAIGLSRRALDAALLARVDAVERGAAVREAAAGRARLDGVTVETEALFLASGKHDVRGLARPREAAGADPALGLRIHLPATPGLAGVIELHLFDRGYAGLVMQEDGRANLCLAVHRSRLDEAGGRPDALLAALGRAHPRLGERLGGAALGTVQAVAQVPYGWRERRGTAGLFRLGDQAGVIPSLAGEGVGIALASAERAVAAYLAGDRGTAFQPRLAGALRRPLAVAGLARDMAERGRLAPAAVALLARMPWLVGALARATRVDALEPRVRPAAPMPA